MCTDPVASKFFKNQQADSSNRTCCDCGSARRADWASVSHGIYISIEASGIHRSLGVKTSFVLSTTMDSWKPVHLRMMELGGNKRFHDFMQQHGVPEDWPIRKKYCTRAAAWYRENLKAEAEGLYLPAPLEAGTGHLPMEATAEGNTAQSALLDKVFAAAPDSRSMTAGGVALGSSMSSRSKAASTRPRPSDSPTSTARAAVSDAAAVVFGAHMTKKLKAALQASSAPIACLAPWKLEGETVAKRLKEQSTGSMDGFGSDSARARRLAAAGA
eukprot:TRINITY_DN2678_c0_g1_i1.p1 TRINITY_DN2678_c0_g1~~TRINITY_DN2678_c0_g1_i1.p1  ORF type:complete len:272 (-),score=57.63 TRINITY_DN2678_c0_g1_i1:308-1123(-)